MSGSSFGFSSWRRPPSAQSQPTPEEDVLGRQTQSSRFVQADARLLSSSASSAGHRDPTRRSFIPGSARDHLSPIDSAQFARSVREDTTELASYVLSDKDKRDTSFLTARASFSSHNGPEAATTQHRIDDLGGSHASGPGPIEEVSELSSSETTPDEATHSGPSVLASMLKHSPPQPLEDEAAGSGELQDADRQDPFLLTHDSRQHNGDRPSPNNGVPISASETTPLLIPKLGQPSPSSTTSEGAIWQHAVVEPARCVPAVIVGLLLNILDALSYGMILFPLGNPIFSKLGPAGISIFYVSTIVAQLTFSFGSKFGGGVGSELIEVVPFFHNMAATIESIVGEDQPDAVIATTITSYALSSMLTGTVFYLMGRFRLGYIVGFIPRHILIGCIGGVGWFLVTTGFEVSARLEKFRYDLDTGRQLIQTDTLPLWLIPLALAILLFGAQKKISSQYFLSVYILLIPLIFYFFVLIIDGLEPGKLRQSGWIFDAPPAGEPWWYFWTLYKFNLVHWGAISQTIGAMFALTFFSLLHVPINVPALAQSIGEDNADLNHELRLHGYSNFLSGLAGSMQNYLVYANTLFFMRSGGDSRLAGFMLAGLTFVMLVIGPVIIGYIPIMMVGTLIFVLGFELLEDALVAPRRKLKIAEYLTIVAIILTMGIYDFVAGIFLGIVLAFVSAIFHASRVPAIRATYTGDQVGSMVRRNPSQHHFLQEVAQQTYIIKLSGFLFFGTIVGVEEKIRALISDESFQQHPIRYMIIDLWHVTGIDYSAGEGFMTISRLLDNKGVDLLISGIDAESRIGRDLRAVGLGSGDIEVRFMPDLNSALESCENEQLKTFYARQEALRVSRPAPSAHLDVPDNGRVIQGLDILSQSPRRSRLHQAAKNVLTQQEIRRATRWQSISEPLRLMLQVFHHVSQRNEDFWFRAKPYFVRREDPAGTVLYHRGERANGFYIVEAGELRADYETPQGRLAEPIVQGTTCGELPFFSSTNRTATVSAVKDATVWVMDTDSWARLQREEPEVAQELLTVSLKLTSERMNAMTNYISAVGN
ncbi:hypothetical protein DL766_001285 [Monosporascus sp. MC13-8B]|uniref:STAS domain-containing protein n=1 Tax=Monosporascus cannonballus TaxID=155416 RepID=A0ABY0GYN7_9PEZI|nr:hypothetical protein DL762_007775 [Monosporascus cannonballus]RYO84033.1 hypothetical protein DL763_007632 [Monosporascus cannonballus]RYP37797.1 hypothetical protein DL766_001285 [Monosporascus sp. MC13-8B]